MNQFGNAQPSRSPDPAHCAQCEAMLTDALDRSLSPEDQAIFDRHLAICPECSRMFIDARLGADLLRKLHKARPEPSADLLARILSTTGPAMEDPQPVSILSQHSQLGLSAPIFTPETAPVLAASPYGPAKVLTFRRRVASSFRFAAIRHNLMQPRLAMTAAMAFFSIALTLNLTGVRITELKASDFTASSIKRTFYDTNARVVRSIDNLRVVYELESRVRDLQRDNDSSSPLPESSAPAQGTPSDSEKDHQRLNDENQQKRSNPRQRSGSSRTLGLNRSHLFTASTREPGSSPRPGHEPEPVFLSSLPWFFTGIEQGGQA
ncbi:MAG TPA: anti-sigma factor [Edaphobacter sp.]|nr:anti-sigma factor [Edaphobacter sp.]